MKKLMTIAALAFATGGSPAPAAKLCVKQVVKSDVASVASNNAQYTWAAGTGCAGKNDDPSTFCSTTKMYGIGIVGPSLTGRSYGCYCRTLWPYRSYVQHIDGCDYGASDFNCAQCAWACEKHLLSNENVFNTLTAVQM